MKCPICGKEEFSLKKVLKQRLIIEWELNQDEIEYINKQQGYSCQNCNCNLRSMTLAASIMDHYCFVGQFQQFCYSKHGSGLRLLEINSAGGLHLYLKKFRSYVFAEYPKVDMRNLPYTSDSFDLLVHSDTLEHVDNSFLALKECYRVLKEKGVLFYTIPIIFKRMTRLRTNLNNSYHGSQDEFQGEDYRVFTEYGADFWVELLNAGFNNISIYSLDDLSSLAIKAIKTPVKEYDKKALLTLRGKYNNLLQKLRK